MCSAPFEKSSFMGLVSFVPSTSVVRLLIVPEMSSKLRQPRFAPIGRLGPPMNFLRTGANSAPPPLARHETLALTGCGQENAARLHSLAPGRAAFKLIENRGHDRGAIK